MVKRYLMTGMTPNPGGGEAYIMNLVRHIDPEKVQFDYLVNYEEVIAYEQELRTMGADIFRGEENIPSHIRLSTGSSLKTPENGMMEFTAIFCHWQISMT